MRDIKNMCELEFRVDCTSLHEDMRLYLGIY